MDVVIPAIANDVQQAEILALLVRVGQHVLAEQPVLELEAGKASFELPSPATGKIEQILVGIGDDVKVGDVVLTLRTIEDGEPKRSALTPAETLERATLSCLRETCVRASPAARRRARELGVDVDALAAESDGRVTIEQIEARAGGGPVRSDANIAELDALPLRADFEAVVEDWRAIPHDALHRTIDVTCLEATRRRYRDEHESAPRLTLTAFVLKACAIALRQHPRMNSSLIRHGRALAIKRYVHVGVAFDTRRGLDPPVLMHVDQRPLCELTAELESLARADLAATGQSEAPTFSITNLRSFGGSGFTPLVHPPQVGALGMCRARTEAGRTILPVSLAYDRRVNDDAAASSFLATIAELLHDPMAMLMHA
jgi:pyruvate dehydrogenase E2 component (dihydrolipoamide acetyltransferase)